MSDQESDFKTTIDYFSKIVKKIEDRKCKKKEYDEYMRCFEIDRVKS